MTNAEALISGLQMIGDDDAIEFIADYIKCPGSSDCTLDGKDTNLCMVCKARWLKKKWESS